VQLAGETDTLGNYLLAQLKQAVYTLDVSAPGFRKANVTDNVVAIGQRAQVNVKLTLGAVTETVSVSGTAETVLAENASIGQVIRSQSIVELPLNGRNFIQLAQISAGAAPIGIGTSPATSWTGRSDSTLSIDGGRETNNSFLVDGIETRNSRFGNAGIRPLGGCNRRVLSAALHFRSRVRAEFGHHQHYDSFRYQRPAPNGVRVSPQPQF